MFLYIFNKLTLKKKKKTLDPNFKCLLPKGEGRPTQMPFGQRNISCTTRPIRMKYAESNHWMYI